MEYVKGRTEDGYRAHLYCFYEGFKQFHEKVNELWNDNWVIPDGTETQRLSELHTWVRERRDQIHPTTHLPTEFPIANAWASKRPPITVLEMTKSDVREYSQKKWSETPVFTEPRRKVSIVRDLSSIDLATFHRISDLAVGRWVDDLWKQWALNTWANTPLSFAAEIDPGTRIHLSKKDKLYLRFIECDTEDPVDLFRQKVLFARDEDPKGIEFLRVISQLKISANDVQREKRRLGISPFLWTNFKHVAKQNYLEGEVPTLRQAKKNRTGPLWTPASTNDPK